MTRLWTKSFAVCGAAVGPGAEHRYRKQPEAWCVWSQPRWARAPTIKEFGFAELQAAQEVRFLNGGTIPDGQAGCPAWSMANLALYDATTAISLVVLLAEDYPERRMGALRLK